MMTGNSGQSGETGDSIINTRRRTLLSALGSVGITFLAGCQGGGDGGSESRSRQTGTASPYTPREDIQSVDGATLKVPMTELPSNIDWATPPSNFHAFTYDVALTLDAKTGDLVKQLVVDWELSENKITFEIHPDATYSDGTPIKAKHWLAEQFTGRFMNKDNVLLPDLPNSNPTGMDVITNMTWDGKTGTFHSEGGLLKDVHTESLFRKQFTKDWSKLEWGPNDPIVKGTEEIGKETDQPLSKDGFKVVERVAQKYNLRGYGNTESEEPPTVEEVKNTPVSGPWQLSKATENTLVLKPNKHFRNADLINYDQIEVQAHAEPRSMWSAIKSDNLDAAPGSQEPPRPSIIREFPDNIQPHVYGGHTSFQVIYIPGQQKYLGLGPVRQAILYALDKKKLATIRHDIASEVLEQPPGLQAPRNATEYVDDNLASKFQHYAYDKKKATERLKSAGFTQKDGEWYTPDDKRFSIKLSTGNKVVQLENAIVSSLKDFGIDASLETVGNTAWEGRFNDGEFQMTVQPRGYSIAGVDGEMYIKAIEEEARRKRLGLFPNDPVVKWVKNTEGLERSDYDWTHLISGLTPELAKQWTVKAPPVGQPTADPTEEYPVGFYQMQLSAALDKKTRREYMQKLMWVWNWKLPVLPIMTNGRIAFMNHKNWIAPEHDAHWDTGFPGPLYNLMYKGDIQANPDSNHG